MLILEYATRLVRRYPWLQHLPLFGLASQLEGGMEDLAKERPDLLTPEAVADREVD